LGYGLRVGYIVTRGATCHSTRISIMECFFFHRELSGNSSPFNLWVSEKRLASEWSGGESCSVVVQLTGAMGVTLKHQLHSRPFLFRPFSV